MVLETVFVVGAGASKEVNLPTGNELKEAIVGLLDIQVDDEKVVSDLLIKEALCQHANFPKSLLNIKFQPYLRAAQHIRSALPQAISIDNLIDSHRDNAKIAICGKLAIVRSILEAESKSRLFIDRSSQKTSPLNFSELSDTWYHSLFQLLTENCASSDLDNRFKSIALIVFNYDRCIEHYLFNALQNYYQINEEESARLVKLIKIYHPYGSVGTLPWIERSGSIGFGAEPNSNQLLELTQAIKTFAEGTDESSGDTTAIRNHMCNTKKLVFVGFAFHKLNMQLISPGIDKHIHSPICFATAFGISDSDKHVITQQLRNMYKNDLITVNIKSLTCNDFFGEFWRSLSF